MRKFGLQPWALFRANLLHKIYHLRLVTFSTDQTLSCVLCPAGLLILKLASLLWCHQHLFFALTHLFDLFLLSQFLDWHFHPFCFQTIRGKREQNSLCLQTWTLFRLNFTTVGNSVLRVLVPWFSYINSLFLPRPAAILSHFSFFSGEVKTTEIPADPAT